MVFKNRRKLKTRQFWYLSVQKLEVVNEITCLVVNLERTGNWKRDKEYVKTKGLNTFNLINV